MSGQHRRGRLSSLRVAQGGGSGYLAVQIGIMSRRIVPRYVDGHAILLHLLPDALIMKQRVAVAKRVAEIFAADRSELNAGRNTRGDGRRIGIDDRIR